MRRALLFLCLLFGSVAAAQVKPDESLQEQLTPDSFKFEASAIAAKINLFEWVTTISYAIKNDSGMNLYMGIAVNSVSIGSCSHGARARGGLQMLPTPDTFSMSVDITAGPPRAMFVPAGARVAGSVAIFECDAPNPGFPTAPVAMSLIIGKSQSPRAMIQFPLSAEAKVRQVQE